MFLWWSMYVFNARSRSAFASSLDKCGFQPSGTVWYGENEHILLMLDEPPDLRPR